jgi:hypothetical protein
MGEMEDHDLLVETSTNVKNILKILETLPDRVSSLEGDQKAQNVKNVSFTDSIKNWTLANTIGVVFSFIALAILLVIK